MIPRTTLSLIPKKVYLLLFFTGIALGGWAQSKVWSLEDCIATAKANNLQVQRQNLQVGAAKTDLKLAKAANLPNLSGWYTHNLSSGKTVNFEDYTYINTQYQDGNLGIRGRLPLFQGLQGYGNFTGVEEQDSAG